MTHALMLATAALFPFLEASAAETLKTPRLSCQVEDTPASTVLTTRVGESGTPVKFRIAWFHVEETPGKFKSRSLKGSSLTSTLRLGKTTITRTILASAGADCVFIHVHADQPGPVHLTARFVSDMPAEIRDRREIVLREGKTHAHAWVIPFESDVSDDGKAITVAGEGEALIVLNLTDEPEKRPVSKTLARLGEQHDPGNVPPDPHLIWEGVNTGRKE